MLLITVISLMLPFAILALAALACYTVWLTLHSLPVGWGVSLTLTSIIYSVAAYRLLPFFLEQGGVKNNAGAAACLVPVLESLLIYAFLTSNWPFEISAWWALGLPLTLITRVLAQIALEFLLDLVNPTGKRI